MKFFGLMSFLNPLPKRNKEEVRKKREGGLRGRARGRKEELFSEFGLYGRAALGSEGAS